MENITKEQALAKIEELKKYVAEVDDKKEEKTLGIEIMSRYGGVKFKSTKTTFKEAVEEGKANLYGADLRGANLSGADLSGADLYEADLREADLYEADLRGADLSGADLYEADLREADLYEADLSGADLHLAKFYGKGGKIKLTAKQLPDFLNALGFQVEDKRF